MDGMISIGPKYNAVEGIILLLMLSTGQNWYGILSQESFFPFMYS